MGRIRASHLALPVAGLLVLVGASGFAWLPSITEAGSVSAAQGVKSPDSGDSAPPVNSTVTPEDLIRFGSKAVKAKPAGSLRLATYNIENLFDDKDDPALSGKNEDKGETKPVLELRGAAAAIRALDADILALEEIESLEALTWFRDAWLAGMGYDYISSIDAGDARGIEQAVLSRYPIASAKNWPHLTIEGVHPDDAADADAGSPLTLHRSPLRVEVKIGEGSKATDTLTLYVVHHKSGFKSAYWREAEAAKVLELIRADEKTHPGRPLAILGDFNATPDQPTVQTYVTGGLIDVFADRVKGEPEWITHESGRSIDLILGNQVLIDHIAGGSYFVMGVPARPSGVDWRTTPPPEGYGSDHYPVVVDLAFPGVTARSAGSKPELHTPGGGGR